MDQIPCPSHPQSHSYASTTWMHEQLPCWLGFVLGCSPCTLGPRVVTCLYLTFEIIDMAMVF